MHAKILEALPCLSSPKCDFPYDRDKFVQTPFLPTPFCQHSLS